MPPSDRWRLNLLILSLMVDYPRLREAEQRMCRILDHVDPLDFPPHCQSAQCGISRRSQWRSPRRSAEQWYLAKTYATDCGLSKQYLEDQGLVSLRTLWIGIHYPATAPDDFFEPPRADPHAWWCGEGRLITALYPISPPSAPNVTFPLFALSSAHL